MKAIYTTHLCEETGAIIITPAEGTDVRIQQPVSDAHSHVVVDMEREASLQGKWVKAIKDGFINGGGDQFCKAGKWYKVVADNYYRYLIHTDFLHDHFWSKNDQVTAFFDLSDPRDENPDEPKEVKIPFDLERWKAGEGALRVETTGGDEVAHLTHFEGMCLIGKVKSNHISSLGFWNELGKCNHFRPNNDLTLIVKQ